MSSFLEKFNEEIKDESNGIVTETNELEEDKTYLKKKKKQKIITIIVSIVIVITISLLVIFSQIVEVPNFVNGLNTIATKWGKNNDIEIIEEEQYDTKITERIVISQSIKDGSRIFKKSSIKIIVSKGKDPNEKISVPEKDSATASDIKAWKEENDLSNVTIKEEHSSEIETGKIIKYEFENIATNETNFTRSDKLTIIVSKGEKVLNMEDFTSKTQTEAEKWCQENNVIYEVKEKFSDTIENGKIISQSVENGQELTDDTTIVFEVSIGAGIKIPNYSKVSSDEAQELSDKVKLKIKNVYNMNVSYGKLISQSVKAGTTKKETDNEVTLTYSLGKPYFSNMNGISESEIAKTFYEYNQKGVNFTYTIKYVDSSEEKGKIVWTSKCNEFVTLKEEIEIHVSNGSKNDDTKVNKIFQVF
ncbi:MAG: PASTA domain-containing protein [Clostridia bacterium]